MNKHFHKILLILALGLISPFYVFSQEGPQLQTVDGENSINDTTADPDNDNLTLDPINTEVKSPFDIELVVGTQSPWNKKVPITVKVRPSQDTTRTNITWDYPVGLELSDKYESNYEAIPQGQVWSYTIKVKPVVSGTYTVAATATDWGYGSNFTSSESVSVTFNENLVVTPITAQYTTAVTVRYIVIVLLGILGMAVLYILGRIGLKSLKKWLKPPEL